jgi:hypothetical protein
MAGSLRGRGLVIPHVAGAQEGLKGGGLRGWVSQLTVGLAPGWGPAQLTGRDPSGYGSGTA